MPQVGNPHAVGPLQAHSVTSLGVASAGSSEVRRPLAMAAQRLIVLLNLVKSQNSSCSERQVQLFQGLWSQSRRFCPALASAVAVRRSGELAVDIRCGVRTKEVAKVRGLFQDQSEPWCWGYSGTTDSAAVRWAHRPRCLGRLQEQLRLRVRVTETCWLPSRTSAQVGGTIAIGALNHRDRWL
jgi:hypothetical protein